MRGYPTSEETREKIKYEYQNGAKIPNLMHRYKLSDKTIKRIVGIYEFDYDKASKVKRNNPNTNIENTVVENVVMNYINNRIKYLNEQIVKLSEEKRKLREFYDYLTEPEKEKEE